MEFRQEMFRNLMSDWLCYSCKEPPGLGAKKQRFLCIKNSHPLCKDCNRKCECGSEVIQKACQQLEKMADEFPWFLCRHYENGCREILLNDKVEDHQTGCYFRLIHCPFVPAICRQKVIFKDLFDHINDTHKEKKFKSRCWDCGGNGEYPFDYYCWFEADFKMWVKGKGDYVMNPIILKTYDRRIFFVEIAHIGDVYNFWVYIYGSPTEAKNYKAKIEISSYDSKSKFRLTSNPIPLDLPSRKVKSQQLGLIVGDNAIKRMFQENENDEEMQFSINVNIWNLKDKKTQKHDCDIAMAKYYKEKEEKAAKEKAAEEKAAKSSDSD